MERANSLSKVNEVQHGEARSTDDATSAPFLPKVTASASIKGENLNAGLGLGSTKEPIAPKLGIDYPFPPHLEYVLTSIFLRGSFDVVQIKIRNPYSRIDARSLLILFHMIIHFYGETLITDCH